MRRQFLVPLTSLLLTTGCDGGYSCLQGSYPAIWAHVTSTDLGSPLIGALGEVVDRSFRDSLADFQDGYYAAAYDRPGTYAVHIQRPGYIPWDTSGVIVGSTGGDCPMVETENLEIRLAPAP